MSQQLISQKVQRTCEGCGIVKEYELVNPSLAEQGEALAWYNIIREVFDGVQFQKMLVQACSLNCVPAAALKLTLVQQSPESQEPDQIDLASLRASGKVN